MSDFVWYHPSWNGDFRLLGKDDETSTLKVYRPTPKEKAILKEFEAQAVKKKWLAKEIDLPASGGDDWAAFELAAPLAKVEKVLLKIVMPKRTTLSALAFKDGSIVTAHNADEEALQTLLDASSTKDAKAAVSVKRPTPSCPNCIAGSIEPAREVLSAFLTSEQHEMWAKERRIVVEGIWSGHRYVIAHRHTALAQKLGRIAYDMDDGGVMHFFDWSVPPEEEVLAAKLILEHREEWLRNEATCLQGTNWTNWSDVYKNPFGGASDGVESHAVGNFLGGFLRGGMLALYARAEAAKA